MPLAPALKGLLLASSLVAAGVAAYETDPNVREFVDRTTKRAEDVLMDFLENLEREFSPDGVGRSQIRRRRRERERERRAMDFGSVGVGVSRSSRVGGDDGDVVVTASGSGIQIGQGREMRQRHRIEIVDAEDEEQGVSRSGGDMESLHTSATHETLFDQFPASFSTSTLHNIPIDIDNTDDDTYASTTQRNICLINDLNENDDDEHDDDMLASQTTTTTITTSTSLDDLSDLDPFADPPIEPLTPLVLSMPRPSSHDNNEDRSPLTPTSFATSDSPRILTPVTPRTVASASGRDETVSDSYFSDFSSGSASGSGHENVEQGIRRQSVASSGVAFETPDEDEDDLEWGRA